MGPTMADRLRAARARAFVGRARELALFDSLLTGDAPRHLLWVSGPGGIGKSTLLERLADAALAGGRPIVRVNAASLPPTAEAVREAVLRQLGAGDPVGAVLFVDGLEHLAHRDEWFRTDLLPGLPEDTLTVVASRHAPGPRWSADLGWSDELAVVDLAGFDAGEVAAYLAVRGVDPAAGDALLAQTGGHPLALALVSDLLARGQPTHPGTLRVADEPDVVRALLGRFLDEVPEPGRRLALHVLGQARTTTVALLRSVLGPADAEGSFDWLSGLSFVERRDDGVAPHELARVVLEEDLRWRDPEARASLQATIRAHSKQRLLASTGADQQRAAGDLLWYHRRSPVLAAHWAGTEGVHLWVDQATEADLPAVLDLVGAHEGAASVAIHRAWWRAQPEAFHVARAAGDPVHGFLLHVRLDRPPPWADGPEGPGSVRHTPDPLASAAWDLVARLAPLRTGEHLRVIRSWVGRDGYHRPTATNQAFTAAVTRQVLAEPGLAATVAYAVGVDLWTPMYAYADYARAEAGDATVEGTLHAAYLHDWRVTPPADWLELVDARAAAGGGEARAALEASEVARRNLAGGAAVLSETEFATAVKEACRSAADAVALARSPLLRTRVLRATSASGHPGADDLRRLLVAEVAALKQRPRRETAARALELTYLTTIRTQEAAASRMSLPFSTYRRHRAAGLAEVTAALWRRELPGG